MPENLYQCIRCGGLFDSHGKGTVRCPFCAMICDEVTSRVKEIRD